MATRWEVIIFLLLLSNQKKLIMMSDDSHDEFLTCTSFTFTLRKVVIFQTPHLMSQSVKELTSGDPQGARALTLLSIRSMVMQSHSHLSVNYIYHPCNRKLIIFPLKQHILTKHFFDFTVFDHSGRRKMRNHIFHLTIHVLSK